MKLVIICPCSFSAEMSADKEIDHLVPSLELIPHLEGGFFGEQYRTDRQVTFIQPNKFVHLNSENDTLTFSIMAYLIYKHARLTYTCNT